MLKRLGTPYLAALTLCTDVLILVIIVPLERYSLLAVRQDAPAAVLAGLLAANIALLGMVIFAIFVNGSLLARLANKFGDNRRAP